PAGALGVCKKPGAKRPTIVSEKLWENTSTCTPRTPEQFIRLGYGDGEAAEDPQNEKRVERILAGLRDGLKDGGNNQLVAMLRGIRDEAIKNPAIKDRVACETARTSACDFTYLLNTMSKAREEIDHGEKCTAEAYDPKTRTEACIFDTANAEGL